MSQAGVGPLPLCVETQAREPDPGRFRCTGCGDCCRIHRVPLTASDLERLGKATALAASALVDWLSPGEVDMTGEPESFVVLPGGRRLPVLAHEDGACRLLDAANRCDVYEARPTCCRTFPLELEETTDGEGRRRLAVLPDARCPGTFDGPDDSQARAARLELRRREIEHHAGLVAAWNRRQRRHRWAKGRIEGAEAFLAFVLRNAMAEEAL